MEARTQTPIAVVGLACRLPGSCNTPEEFWRFLLDGRIADTTTPSSRFGFEGHYDGTLRPWTMRSPGGMFIDADPKDLDAGFFGLSQVDAISMDPQQRQLLEVVYEGLENAGLTLEGIKSKPFGCFVGSYASDYSDIQTRDPEDRTPSFTVGSGRAMLSNRISHFLDIKGPSMTIDTACSGSLISVDLACRYLESGDADGAIVAGCNLYMSPEHNMDQHAMTSAASPSGRCWTFDSRADGYIKAEAINALILKRLDDAVRDGDPIRAVIRGTSTNSDGWTPGIASPNADAQAVAIRRAYERAGISNFKDTAYLECHGTGTLAGDPIECRAASSVFSASRSLEEPLRIGSVKSNIGHSEPAAGISGMIKTILSVERGVIPGNPTFEFPNPNIDFQASKILPSRVATPWPHGMLRRASVNSFGYGGSNAHAILEHPTVLLPQYQARNVSCSASPEKDIFLDDDDDDTRRLLVFSANDETSLRAYVKELHRYVSNPALDIDSADLAYTLSERRTRHFHRAYVLAEGSSFKINQASFGKIGSLPRIGLVFTGQGAQWPQMGKALLDKFPVAKKTVMKLEEVLRSMTDPPSWSLLEELTQPRSAEHMRLPEFSQPLVTALQLGLLAVLKDWGLNQSAVIGHSSGEIAAAVAAGLLSEENGIKVAYLRGKAAKDIQGSAQHMSCARKQGMLAIGLGPQDIKRYMTSFPRVKIACRNSPKSVTLSGEVVDLEALQAIMKSHGHFARLLLVDLAYHSDYMHDIASHYKSLLDKHCENLDAMPRSTTTRFFSTVYGSEWEAACNTDYWVANMVSPVLFNETATALINSKAADFLIEIGPSGALAGPIKQIKQAIGHTAAPVRYSAAFARDTDSVKPLYELAGELFISNAAIDLLKVNNIWSNSTPRSITDLPNYQWNHSVKYWHESLASKDWRYRNFPVHDLLGSKVLGTSWSAPSWKRVLRLKNVPWIRDHTLGSEVVFPASGYVAMAMEAMFQTARSLQMEVLGDASGVSQVSYRLRDVRFLRALALSEDVESHLYLFLDPAPGPKDAWFRFRIATLREVWTEHCTGSIRIDRSTLSDLHTIAPLEYPIPARLWYKSMQSVGFNFGPMFQNLSEIESIPGRRDSRARIKFPKSDLLARQSNYPVHPAVFDTFFQSGIPSLYNGHRTTIEKALVPQLIDEIFVAGSLESPSSAIAVTNSSFTTGRPDEPKNFASNIVIIDEVSQKLVAQIKGLHYTELDISQDNAMPSTCMRVNWKTDISLLRDGEIALLPGDDSTILSDALALPNTVTQLLLLLRHKLAVPSVLDLSMLPDQGQVPQIDQGAISSQFPDLSRYVLATNCPQQMLNAQKQLQGLPAVEFHIYDVFNTQEVPFAHEDKFDLIVLRMPSASKECLATAYRKVRDFLSPSGFLVLLQDNAPMDQAESTLSHASNECTKISKQEQEELLFQSNFEVRAWHSLSINSMRPRLMVYLCSPVGSCENGSKPSGFSILNFSKDAAGSEALIDNLRCHGWTGKVVDLQAAAAIKQPTVPLVLVDDPHQSLLATIEEPEWTCIKTLLISGHTILWLATGSQISVSKPSNALVHGFARSIRGEGANMALKTLDVSSYTDPTSAKMVLRIVDTLVHDSSGHHSREFEYCERNGLLHINRFLPSERLPRIEQDVIDVEGAELEQALLRQNPKTVRLHCEKLGAMNSLHYNELPGHEPQLGEGEVEVEILAAGLNYKDVATSLGIVPENEHLLGLEGAGIIKRVGSKVHSYSVGDRVLVHGKGSFANRNRVPKENIFLLPDSVSFPEAATMSIVFFTAIYGLSEVANLKAGQSILLHSAAGGVGLASVQLCQHLGVEIYATVGNDEKRQFLHEQYGIPLERIFSSRTMDFAAGIRALTNGRGVDCVLNFLTGDLLDASWRLLADNGILVEIGKKDITDRNLLSMEPFNRNCTFRGVDISQPSILDDLPLIERVLQTIRKMLLAGSIKPISPMKCFSFGQIPDAMRYMRSGEHIGKIVIWDESEKDVLVPTRRAPLSLDFDSAATYLIVGGLKGLCGSIAIYLARCGVKHLLVLSRSKADDERSLRVIRDAASLGTTIQTVSGDVSVREDVDRIFQESPLPIAGIIHGAMVLQDKLYENMTTEEFHAALGCKFSGTWNLHMASEKAGHHLSFFTMLSSISGVVGTAGQANYASGNSFQDAFASYRRRLGLAAHAVDLGIIEDIGYMSEHQGLTDRVQSRSQLTGINERQLHEIIRLSVLKQTTNGHRGAHGEHETQMVTGLPYPVPQDSPLLQDMRFSSLLVSRRHLEDKASEVGGGAENLRAFHALVSAGVPAAQLIPEATKLINNELVRILGLPGDVEESKLLSSYGIDSLAAVDLRNWFKTRLQVEFTTLDILNAISLNALSIKTVKHVMAKREEVRK